MALSIRTQDIDNFPGVTKTVSVDLDSIVAIGSEGDESYILSVSTNAYSSSATNQRIQDLYITGINSGWCKSSGFVGSAGKYEINDVNNTFRIKIDATVSGIDGSGFYNVVLAVNDDQTPIEGEVIAADMEEKIHAIAEILNPADIGLSNAYRSACVEFRNGKFWVASGSISKYYTGNNRSSVVIMPGLTNDCSKQLGFDLSISSLRLSSISVKESLVNTDYTPDTEVLSINTGTGARVGLAYMITNGVTTDFFTTLSGTTDSNLKVATLANNGYIGISNTYTAYNTKVQLLKEQDPENSPNAWFTNIDSLVRYGIKTMINQIDYSS